MIFHVHIPKTAGTSLTKIFEAIYGNKFHRINLQVSSDRLWNLGNPNFITDNVRKIRQLDVIGGHVPFRNYPILPEETKFITFLREPLERMWSLYWYLIYRRSAAVMKSSGNPVSFQMFNHVKELSCVDNDMVRFLSGMDQYGMRLTDKVVTGKELNEAKENLEKFFFVGFQDRYESDLTKLSKMLKWSVVPIPKREHLKNDLKPPNPRERVTPTFLRSFDSKQRYDIELYEYAKRMFS